jgi:hypothetical protein
MVTLDLQAARRVLVVVTDTVPADVLHAAIRAQVHDSSGCDVLLLAPALNTPARHWLVDEDRARRSAYRRLREILDDLSEAGVEAEGIVGDADPIQAIRDALAVFPADSVLVASRPESHWEWLEGELVARTAELTSRPVTRVVVDDGPAAVAKLPVPAAHDEVRPAA